MSFDTRISLKKLELLCLVADLGSIKEAAERLYVTQPVVTAHIRSLNERLGVELLYRDGNRMRLTESGAIVYRWASELLMRTRDLEQQLARFSDGLRGSARVASSMTVGSYLLPPVVSAFKLERPEVHIAVAVASPEQAVQEIDSGEADFGVVIAEEDLDLAPDVERELLGHEPLVLVTAPDSAYAEEDEVLADELAEMSFVSSPRDQMRQRLVDRFFREMGLGSPNLVLEFGHAEAMKGALRAGVGVGFLFRSSVAEALALGQLREIGVAGHDFSAPILLLHRKRRELSRAQMDLIAAIRRAIRDRDVVADAVEVTADA
jgi:DNA-binding transcriptional LysR family regulator